MLILAVETSGIGGSLALLRDGETIDQARLDPERRHARSLVPEIQALLQRQSLTVHDCHALAVSIGPGSFTGLRVGITCVKTLSYATGVPITSVPTFPCLAEGCPSEIQRVQVIMNAQRGELFVGRFARGQNGQWIEEAPLQIEPTSAWMTQLTADDVVVGPGLDGIHQELQHRCHLLTQPFWYPQARQVGVLGARFFLEGRFTSCWELLPLYIRKSAAEEKWDAKQLALNQTQVDPG